jgi:hypothetical protein
MVRFTVHYKFVQKFPFPARDVYDWSTDYREDDIPLTGNKGKREIEKLDEATLILTDTVDYGSGPVTKVRLIRMFPKQLLWINTRLSEAGKHSQFVYQIIPEGKKASRLEFYGAQVEEASRRPSAAKVARMAKELAETDALVWVNLARAMKADFGPSRSRGTSRNRAR